MKFNVFGKLKDLSMRTKRIAALVICLSLLTVAIVQNMKPESAEAGGDAPDGDVNISVGGSTENTDLDTDTGVMKVSDAEEYFAAIRLNRLNSRSRTEESCNEIIESETASESNVADAVAAIEDLRKISQMENDVETAVRARGYGDVFTSIEKDCIYITVLSESLDEAEVSAIASSASGITGYPIEGIILKGVY